MEKKTNIVQKMGFFSYIYTMFFVIIGWVIFRSDNFSVLKQYLGYMFGIGSNGIVDSMAIDYIKFSGIALVVGIIASFPIGKFIKEKIKINNNIKDILEMIFVVIIFILSILVCIRSTYNPFIYFNF